jgi:hypothetical protein
MNRKNVRSLVEGVIETPKPESPPESPPKSPPEVLAVAPVTGSADDAFRNWTRTPQYGQNTTLHGINPQRLQSVMQSRVEAAFRAGYAAGLGDSI